MKYVVTRSNYSPRENPKCPGTQKEMVSKNGNLVEAYTIELNSLEELSALSEKVESPIMVYSESWYGFDIPELEIYNGYRE